ncbi:ATP phosphoribosyltransferase regulatory subunit [Oribacterium sp. WCC10]|uniref:ATP phosphoribosyltransferase regulatory subunit n=1 Tax=Oribacterium sp. WCC10 TaxID=1855343 RepID=UPI0008F07A8A|nr:ATP phosphoribosyltransferase regulatory subunit [Oribacterium sp. WCC10]SFG29808.1 ATP phosphoribosyltransferase regulatory subunit [Oribacterium sp. WCC10]
MNTSEFNDLYERYGYRQFKMTKFEPYDLYADNRDFLKSNQLITFTDLDGSLLALKPDVTLSIIKSNLGGEEKVYYNETVYRPKDNRYHEIPQSGIECIGRIDSYSEAEVIALAAKSLKLVSERYVIRVSDAAFLKQMFETMGLSEKTEEEAVKLFSMKSAAGFDDLVKQGKLTEASAVTLKGMVDLYKPFKEGVKELKKYAISNVSAKMVAHLSELASILDSFGVLDSIYLDFSLVNSMDYYNGLIFQGAVADIPFTVLSGGRYDKLPEKMGRDVGAIGFALYLDTVENYLKKVREYDVDYLITYDGDSDTPAKVAAVVETFNRAGSKVRSVRLDELSKMEHKIKARKVLTLCEAEKEAAEI